jgi:glutamate-1-semialdehyde 2,1-aminomutase
MSREHIIESLKEEIRQRTPRSGELLKKAKKVLPNGEISSVRGFDPWPFYAKKADGVQVWDIDGNEYMDFCMCYGVLLLGHRPVPNVNAIKNHLKTGAIHYGMPTPAEITFGEKFVPCVPCAEQVMLCNTGNEAVHKAVAIARAYTGKDKVAKFEGGFHGSNEYCLWSVFLDKETMGPVERPNVIPMQAGMPKSAEDNIVVLPFGHDAAIQMIEEQADELAVVMLEPALGPGALAFDPEFLRKLQEVTERCGVLLLFDEIITGFRLALGGGQELFGVTPDIGLFGKSLGGGSPIGAIATRTEIFEKVMNLEPPVMATGTFSGNAVTLNNTIAMIDHLVENNPSLYEDLASKGDQLRNGFNEFAKQKGIPATMTGTGSMWQVHMIEPPVTIPRDRIKENHEAVEEFNLRLRLKGIFVPEHSHIAFLSTAHSEANMETLIFALKKSLEECFSGS